MRFSMLYSGEQILSFKSCLVFYAGDSLKRACLLIFKTGRQMNFPTRTGSAGLDGGFELVPCVRIRF